MKIFNLNPLKRLYGLITASYLSNVSIRTKLIIVLIAITLIPVSLTGIVSYKISSESSKREALKSAEQALLLISRNVNQIIEQLENISALIVLNEDIKNILEYNPGNDLEKLRLSFEVNNKYLENFVTTSDLISNIIIYAENYDYSFFCGEQGESLAKNFKNFKEYQEAKKRRSQIIWYGPHTYEGKYFDFELKNVISMTRSINKYGENKFLGVLEIQVKSDRISRIINNLVSNYDSIVFIIDEANNIISSDSSLLTEEKITGFDFKSVLNEGLQGSVTKKINGNEFIFNYVTLKNGWKVVYAIPYDTLMNSSRQVGLSTLIITISFILLALLISLVISYSITKPIKNLIKSMNKVKEGDFNTLQEFKGKNEIGQLSETFNIMVTKIKELIVNLVNEQKKKKEAELNVLQAQITPHFLYNTLNLIKCMAVIKNVNEIADVTKALINLLELSINNKKDFITIEDEIEMTNQYILLQSYKLSKKFDVVINVEEDIYTYKTLKLILQPLVENAILHGFDDMQKQCEILIQVKKENDRIILSVKDNGVGMTAERIDEVLKKSSGRSKFNRIGINNINERIKIHFGENYGLKIYSKVNEGTCIAVDIPAFKDENELKAVR